MSVVDLHPESLLDKEIRGELDDGERARLEAHLARCAACRLERQLRADFARELSLGEMASSVAALVDDLARRGAPAPPPAQRTPVVSRRTTRSRARVRRMQVVGLAAAATLTLVVGAFAATEVGRRAMAPWLGRARTADTVYGEAKPAVTIATAARGRGGAAAAVSAAVPAPEATASPDPAPVPVGATTGTAPASPVAAPPAPATAPAPSAAAPPDGPAPLFASETEARRRGDLGRVLALHAELVARYPASGEAQVSRMLVARMRLDRGDAAEALAGFDAYLRRGAGELREDALAGRATALDRLGRTSEATRAWAELLDEYPDTAYGAHARARVEGPGER